MNSHSTAVPAGQPAGNHWRYFLAHLMFVFATWTVFIKYLFPLWYSLLQDEPLNRYIYWDLWPLAHVWLGWALLRRPRYTRLLAIAISITEIGIIVTFLTIFLLQPEWTIWRGNWFINKVFLLVGFILILITAILRPEIFGQAKGERGLEL